MSPPLLGHGPADEGRPPVEMHQAGEVSPFAGLMQLFSSSLPTGSLSLFDYLTVSVEQRDDRIAEVRREGNVFRDATRLQRRRVADGH